MGTRSINSKPLQCVETLCSKGVMLLNFVFCSSPKLRAVYSTLSWADLAVGGPEGGRPRVKFSKLFHSSLLVSL